MGRYLIFIVLAAVVGGATLMLSMQRSRYASDVRHAEGQADVLAREIAEAGNQAAVGAMVSEAGFTDPTVRLGTAQDYGGGRFTITYTPGTTDDEATVTVVGSYGGAVHTTERTYAREEMDAPGPLWLDVPHATGAINSRAAISGGPDAKPAVFDRRQHDTGGLEAVAPLADLEAALGAEIAAAGSRLSIPDAAAWSTEVGLTDGVNAPDAAALYRRTVAAKGAGDRTLVGDQTVTGSTTWGAATDGTQITHVDGDLTVSGSLTGHGALVVDGALRVPGELDWDGLVIVHGTDAVLPVRLTGRVTLDGMLVVSHDVLPTSGTAPVALVTDILNRLTTGTPFGTQIELGDRVSIRFDLAQVKELAAKLGFDGDGVRLVASTSSHLTAAEARASGAAPAVPTDPPPTEPGTAQVGPFTITATPNQPIATSPNEWVQMCHPAYGAATTWVTEEIKFRQVEHYLSTIEGALYGPCSDHGL